jgi:hypothetical protein
MRVYLSYSLSGMGHPPHRSGCVSMMFFALLSRSSLVFFWMVLLSCLWMSFARDSSNDGFVVKLLYMSCSLSDLLFSVVQTVVPFGLCSVVCVGFVECCVSSERFVD